MQPIEDSYLNVDHELLNDIKPVLFSLYKKI